jgi:hypothetical protein
MSDHWHEPLRARLSGLRLAPEREHEIIEELSQHLDDRHEELRRSGASDADARRLALDGSDHGATDGLRHKAEGRRQERAIARQLARNVGQRSGFLTFASCLLP